MYSCTVQDPLLFVQSRYLSSCTVQVILCTPVQFRTLCSLYFPGTFAPVLSRLSYVLLYSSGPLALCTVQVPLLLYCPGSVLFVLLTRSLHSSYRLLVERVWPSYLRKQKGLPVELSKIEGQLSWIYCNWQIHYIQYTYKRICLNIEGGVGIGIKMVLNHLDVVKSL